MGVKPEQTGKEEWAPTRRPPGRSPKQPGSRGARTASRAAGDSSLNLENNFEFMGLRVGVRRSKLLQAVLNLEPSRALFAREEGASPEGVPAPRVSQRAPARGRAAEGGGEESLKRRLEVRDQGDHLSSEEEEPRSG